MNKCELSKLVDQGLSQNELAAQLGIGQTTVRYWLKKFGLKTQQKHLLATKFSDEEILDKWQNSDSVNQFLLSLGVNNSGGAWYHYQKRLKNLGCDLGSSTVNGRVRGGQKTAQLTNQKAILQKRRLPRHTLKKALDLAGRTYECQECFLAEWRGVKLKLHIHHKNEDCKDNRVDNLEYVCPNCHSIKHYKD